jgi:hypothetical protein
VKASTVILLRRVRDLPLPRQKVAGFTHVACITMLSSMASTTPPPPYATLDGRMWVPNRGGGRGASERPGS